MAWPATEESTMTRTARHAGCGEHLALDQLHRRTFLRVGGLSLLGLSLPQLYAAQQAHASDYLGEREPARARSCILLFLSGGPSHYETFDPKPDAPSENRTIFGTVQTRTPGVLLCEHLHDLARLQDKFALVRSMTHRFNGHFGAHRYALSGHVAPGNPDQPARADDKPGLVGLAARHLRGQNMPSVVMAPWIATDQGSGASGGMGGGTLGRQFDPVRVEVDNQSLQPGRSPVFRLPELALRPELTISRFDGRRSLLSTIESQQIGLAQSAQMREMDDHYQHAYELLTSSNIRQGFDIEQEPYALRNRYGQDAFGQSCLLARRLVERGARFVQVNFSRYVSQPGYGWDTHDRGRETLQTQLLPKLNAGVASLIDDLHQRGLLDETLVVAMGEFGRTPRVKPDGGRDHWNQSYSILLAGGGIHGGLVYGRTTRDGAEVAVDPVEPREIICTILTLLGIPTFQVDPQGRAAPLFEGVEPVRRLFA
jgi:uncharacterized protein (DUF1501 family)